jgi:hypothetical protein
MTRIRRTELILAGVGIVVGICGLVAARDLEFTAAAGGVLFERSDDMIWGKLLEFSPLGAIVTIVLASVAMLGAWFRVRALVLIAAGGFAVCALQVIVQFGRSDNVFGVRGGNLALFLAMAVGLATLAVADSGETADTQVAPA